MLLLRSPGMENKLFSVLFLCSTCMCLLGMLQLFHVKRRDFQQKECFSSLANVTPRAQCGRQKTCQVHEQLRMMSTCKETCGKILPKRESSQQFVQSIQKVFVGQEGGGLIQGFPTAVDLTVKYFYRKLRCYIGQAFATWQAEMDSCIVFLCYDQDGDTIRSVSGVWAVWVFVAFFCLFFPLILARCFGWVSEETLKANCISGD